MDYMACISNGVFPTSATSKERATFAVSYGLIDFVLTEAAASTLKVIFDIGRKGIRAAMKILRIGR